MSKIKYLILSIVLVPSVTSAFSLAGSNFKSVIQEMLAIIGILVPILASLSFLVFFWGLSKFILNSDKPEEIKNGKNYMMWGVVVLFILLTYRTIVGLVSSELEIGSRNPVIPVLNTTAE